MNQHDLLARLKQGRYGDSTTEIFQLCKAAVALNDSLPFTERKAWLEQQGLHPDTWAKVISVGRAEPLHDPEIAALLPASFSTLALLSRCTRKDFDDARKQGLITPKLTHRTLAAWRKQREDRQLKRAPALRLMPLVIALDPDADTMDMLAIQTAMQDAVNSLSVKGELIHLLNGWDNPGDQALQQWQQARLEDARAEVNRMIAPLSITAELLNRSLGEIKDHCATLDHDGWIAVYNLKNAHTSLYGPTKQQRYAARSRLQAAADHGHEFSRELVRVLLGRSESSVAN
jgi:hypothetical protein